MMSSMGAAEDRLEELEARVRSLEDQLAIYRVLATWGPAADTANGAAAASIWTDDAVLETERHRVEGGAAIGSHLESDGQHQLVAQGCAHVQGLPLVQLDGDRAVATNYGRVYLHGDDGYEVWRVSVNRWELRRTDEGWRASRRVVHVIDGGPEAQALLSAPFSSR
jgi:ketosteroid isomerase-like protein